MKNKHNFIAKLSIPYIIWMFIFIVLPMILVLLYSITAKGTANNLDLYPIKFTFKNYKMFFQNSAYYISLVNSLKLAFIATVFSFVLGYPVAYFLSQQKGRKRNILLLIIVLPMWTNMLLRTYAWRFIIGRSGLINQLIVFINQSLSINIPKLDIMNSGIAVTIGMTYNYLPFMILPIYAVLVKLDKDLVYAAFDLGANKFWTFVKIIFPLSIPGVLSGVTMVFLPAATSFVIPFYLGGGKELLIGSLIEKYFKGAGNNPNFGSALSIILMVLIFLLIGAISLKSQDDERGESLW